MEAARGQIFKGKVAWIQASQKVEEMDRPVNLG
jgi:hypothetical protein